MDPVHALIEMGGIAALGELQDRTTRKRLRTAVSRGDVVRISRGRYCLPHAANAYADAQRSGAYLSHLSAALHHGWAVRMPPTRTHLVPTLPVRDRDGWATEEMRTIRDCAADLPFADALAVADSALRAGAVSHDELLQASVRWPSGARRVVLLAHERAKNPFESALRANAIEAGLQVVPQWAVTVDGVTVHPDVADPWAGLALEADSWAHHAREKSDHDRDCGRYNLLVVAGWRVLRFTWAQVMFDALTVERVLTRAVSRDVEVATRRGVGEPAA